MRSLMIAIAVCVASAAVARETRTKDVNTGAPVSGGEAAAGASDTAAPKPADESDPSAAADGMDAENPDRSPSDAEAAATAQAEAAGPPNKATRGPKAGITKLQATIPWLGAFLQVSGEAQRATVRVRRADQGSVLGLEISAPLNEESREAPFLSTFDARPAFRVALSYEYQSTRKRLHDVLQTGLVEASFESDCHDEAPREPETDGGPNCEDRMEAHVLGQRAEAARQRIDDVDLRAPSSAFDRRGVADWGLGVEASAAMDRLEAYGADDIAADAPDAHNPFELEVGAVGRLYASRSVALFARAGYAYSDELQVSNAKRCQTLTSSDDAIGGQSCADVKVVVQDPGGVHKGYAEAGVVYLPFVDFGESAPGAELRFGATEISADKTVLRGRAVAFLTPTSQPLTSRFGIAVDHFTDLDAGEQELVASLIVGAGF